MRRIVTISYTPIDAPGGVPRWNRDFHSSFIGASPGQREVYSAVHYSWWDHPASSDGLANQRMSEPEKAKALNLYLLQKRLVTPEDVVVADGFWLAGLEHFPRAVSVCHGIWGHLTKADVDAGKQPENPYLHAAQVEFRRKCHDRGTHMVAVSNFIADEIKMQWGWTVPVINTGIDLQKWRPVERPYTRNPHRPIIIHGVNDHGNVNKGWDHVEALREHLKGIAFVHSLDDLKVTLKLSSEEAFSMADLCVIPSGFEGNSLFALEALACDLPVVCYNVGLPYKAWADRQDGKIGRVLDRRKRSPGLTASTVKTAILQIANGNRPVFCEPRKWVSQFSIESFRQEWRDYVEGL